MPGGTTSGGVEGGGSTSGGRGGITSGGCCGLGGTGMSGSWGGAGISGSWDGRSGGIGKSGPRLRTSPGAGGPGENAVGVSPAGSISGVLVGLGTSGGTEGG